MTEIAAVNLNAIWRSFTRPNLTKEQVFRLWRCAVMDDDKLVDEVIQHAYEGMIAFDCGRAECVMGLMIRRHMTAGSELRTFLRICARSAAPIGFRSYETDKKSQRNALCATTDDKRCR